VQRFEDGGGVEQVAPAMLEAWNGKQDLAVRSAFVLCTASSNNLTMEEQLMIDD
jgi:hypothetical protein